MTEDAIVNVASVVKLSPFRYPGGKTWLVPTVLQWLACRRRPRRFIELFAGGGIVGLTVLARQLADEVLLVELDAAVGAVWEALVSGAGPALAERIRAFDLTEQGARAVLAAPDPSPTEHARFRRSCGTASSAAGSWHRGRAL